MNPALPVIKIVFIAVERRERKRERREEREDGFVYPAESLLDAINRIKRIARGRIYNNASRDSDTNLHRPRL
jgi:hypothetical protein